MALICSTLETAFIVKKLVSCAVWGEGRGVRTSSCPPPVTGCLLLCASHSYSYMIDNVILLITGTLHQRSIAELVPKCHPLGSFEQMEAVNIAQTPAELYNAILVDTPLGELLRWRREEVGISVNASNVKFAYPWRDPEPECEACPLLPTFMFPSTSPPILSSSHCLLLYCCFVGPGKLPQGPDSDYLSL